MSVAVSVDPSGNSHMMLVQLHTSFLCNLEPPVIQQKLYNL